MKPVSRVRVASILLVAVALEGVGLELAWVSTTGIAVGTDREQTVSLAGGAALPWATGLILLTLIAIVGAWVLPWWLRILTAGAGAVAALVLGVQAIRWLIAPDTSSIIADVSGSDVVSEELHLLGPSLFLVALLLSMTGFRWMLSSARAWPALAARYERGGRAEDPWSALDRGIDPTEDPR